MTPERWATIRRIFEEALAKPDVERENFVDAACGGDTELKQAVDSMIAEDSAGDDFLERPMWNVVSASEAGLRSGQYRARPIFLPKVGSYTAIGVLGEGGMGTVYEAQQEHPRRTVALKMIKPGWVNAEMLRRFEQESQALGRLQHPGIAQIYEAGMGDAGYGPQPFFAMELIRGHSLLKYADDARLGLRDRLELMIRICQAVDHAHRRGIIHRDLKPGNILVDSAGQPKILDFGVARVADNEAVVTRQTDIGQIVGTLAYMSPEQLAGASSAIDTRTDVYSLGVILYELLAGKPPFQLSPKLLEAVETLRNAEAEPLGKFQRDYQGDVETIVVKAMEKERERRYGSAAALAADLERYLRHEPILARPATLGYQLMKFARRHRPLVAGAAAVLIVLIGGVVVSTREAIRARRAQQIADTVNEFLQNDLLAQASVSTQARPGTKPDPDIKVRTVLDRASAKIEGKFAAQPLVEASIRQTIAQTYNEIGLYAEGLKHAERARALRERALGPDHADTLASMARVAELYRLLGRFAEAEPLAKRVLDTRRRVLGPENSATLDSMGEVALVNQELGKPEESVAILEDALKVQRRISNENDPSMLRNLDSLGKAYLALGKYQEMEAVNAKLLDRCRQLYGEEHPSTLAAMQGLGLAYSKQRKDELAESILSKTVEIERRVQGEQSPDTLLAMDALASAYLNRSDFARAEAIDKQILETDRRILGADHPNTMSTMNNLAVVYLYQGKYPQAEALTEEVVSSKKRILGVDHPDTLSSMNTLAVIFRNQGKYDRAEPLLKQVLEGRKRVLSAEHPNTLKSMHALAVVYFRERKYADAEAMLSATQELRKRILGEHHPDTRTGMTLLGEIKMEQRKFSEAEEVLRQAAAEFEQPAADGWERFHSRSLLGGSLSGQGKHKEAEPLLLTAYAGLKQHQAEIPGESRASIARAGQRVVELYQLWNKPDMVTAWRTKIAGAK